MHEIIPAGVVVRRQTCRPWKTTGSSFSISNLRFWPPTSGRASAPWLSAGWGSKPMSRERLGHVPIDAIESFQRGGGRL